MAIIVKRCAAVSGCFLTIGSDVHAGQRRAYRTCMSRIDKSIRARVNTLINRKSKTSVRYYGCVLFGKSHAVLSFFLRVRMRLAASVDSSNIYYAFARNNILVTKFILARISRNNIAHLSFAALIQMHLELRVFRFRAPRALKYNVRILCKHSVRQRPTIKFRDISDRRGWETIFRCATRR